MKKALASKAVTAESVAPIASTRAFRLRDSALCTCLFIIENVSSHYRLTSSQHAIGR